MREWRWLALFVALALFVPLIGSAIYSLEAPRAEHDALGDMQAIARLKTEQIENWLAERQANAVTIAASLEFGAYLERLAQGKADGALARRIHERFEALRAAHGFYNILLTDDAGRSLVALDARTELSARLRNLLRESLASRQVQRSGLYRDDAGHARLDWVSPVVISDARGERAAGAIVMRSAPQHFLYPLIQARPTASRSAETLLVRREGDSAVYLNELRHETGTALVKQLSLRDHRDLPAAVALDASGAGTVRGPDYRGIAVLAAYRPVAETDWRVVVKIDRDEVLAPLRQLALWISVIAFAASAALSVAFLLLLRQQRRAQALALLARDAHADRVLRNFFDLSFIGIGITSSGTKRWLKFNDRLCAILGRTREELAEIDWMSITHPEDRERNFAEFDSVMRGESEGYTVDKRFIRKDGTVVHTTVDVRCVRKPDGTPELFVATVLDITEGVQAAQTVRESEARFRTLTEMSSDFYWESDAGHRLTRRGSAGKASTVSIFQRGAQIGERRWEIPHLSPDEAGWRAHRATLDAHLPFRNFELSRLGSDGSERHISLSGDPVFDETGAFIGYRGVGADVTERKRADDALRQLSSALEQSPLSIVITDVAGRIEYVNPYFEQSTGYRSDEVLGCNPRILASGKTPRETYRELWATVSSGRTWRGEFWNQGKSGEVFLERASISPIVDETGRVTHFVAVKDDITALRQAEQMRDSLEAQLRQSQKMEALGTLAGGVAHDFNNVLATILGNVELARQDLGDRHAARESLEEIAKASRRAKGLVQQILAFGRRQTVSREVISLVPVVEDAARLLRATVPAGVTLNVDCGRGAPQVLADASQVHQVIINLGSNAWHAVQALDRRGEIDLRLERRVHAAGGEPAHLPPGTYACLSVRDNGPGMDETLRDRIFEPFFTTKPVDQGTGLGLSVVHGIVHKHDAHIVVDSTPGKGATFLIYFPAVETAEPGAMAQGNPVIRRQDAAAPLPKGRGKHVLYVDDDESIVFLMKRLLERQGYRVSGYTDPREALEAARAAPAGIDLAVTDYNMPRMSGLEVARELRKLRADLPVALASGFITDELRAKAPAAGVSELIYKPDTVDELCDTVARLAHGLPGRSRK